MQMHNSEQIRNGDVGTIVEIKEKKNSDDDETHLIAVVDFDGVLTEYSEDKIEDLDLAYCTTVHKSQGSEYKTVIVVMSILHAAMFKRNIIYTAITRSRENVAIFTEKEGSVNPFGNPIAKSALTQAIENDKTDNRWSQLARRLQN